MDAGRIEKSLNGQWYFQPEGGGDAWHAIELPASFEQYEGIAFDGVGIYRCTIPPLDIPEGTRAILHFQAAATEAYVTLGGNRLGSHLGGWTPFRFDLTRWMRPAGAGKSHELVVRLDEKVGHNSQGFLPIIAPHFGGIWQDVRLLVVPDTWIDDLKTLSIGDPKTGTLRIELPLNGSPLPPGSLVRVRYRLRGQQPSWPAAHVVHVVESPTGTGMSNRSEAVLDREKNTVSLAVPVEDYQVWSPAEPNLYEVEIELEPNGKTGKSVRDRIVLRAAFRTIEVDGPRLLLNGQPLMVRGLLNWGYAPPRVAPSVDENHMRNELSFARSLGFNLMKFCLWVPPKRYLELADEMGMLTWVEYPTWHSQWTPDQLPMLEKEFTEFFYHDRNHPSVVLRSLTCETGPSADLGVIQALYDRCHAMIPGSVVEDDSSWIGWNRVHDFYDDHPYGNNHTWVLTLNRLKEHISEREAKSLILGEAIAADTWVDPEPFLQAVRGERPFWLPRFLDGNVAWLERMERIDGVGGIRHLAQESKEYAFLMRKYQIEAYRREVPAGGYVVSVIRDFPLASMGLIDYFGNPKWSQSDWQWHGGSMLILETKSDRRSFASQETFRASIAASHFAPDSLDKATLTLTVCLERGDVLAKVVREITSIQSGSYETLEKIEASLPNVAQPTRFFVRGELKTKEQTIANAWSMWLVPAVDPSNHADIQLHASCSNEVRKMFQQSQPFNDTHRDAIVIAARFDRPLFQFLESGGKVLLLPDGEKGSMPLNNLWFLRGGPYISDHPISDLVTRQFLVELQHFDLAGPVVSEVNYIEQVDPILMFWDNHDIDHVKIHGLLFETRVGGGKLLVSALNHTSSTNAAGLWLLDKLLNHLASDHQPSHALDPDTIRRMDEKIGESKIELVERQWHFRPDPENAGLELHWHLAETALDQAWRPIRIGTAWEGAGYPSLDGWAWYRIHVDIPKAWKGLPVYVSFEGVDDYYELYVNGKPAGSGGDLATKKTAFEDRTSHDVSQLAAPGETMVLAVRVYDWYGAGGLFRPVSVGTARIDQDLPNVLK